jgi:hypothetical protein
MANRYPYVASAGPLIKTIDHLRRRSFPKEVTAETLRKLGVAPKNESYVISVLKFLNIIDGEGKKVDANANVFVQHKDDAFQKEFEALVRTAYDELFELHGDDAWKMDRESLTQFFRTSDHSSEIVGSRQAGTFTYLAALSGHTSLPEPRVNVPKKSESKLAAPKKPSKKSEKAPKSSDGDEVKIDHSSASRVGLTVRVEVNLPAEGDQQTYDRIFRSIRKNLIDGE